MNKAELRKDNLSRAQQLVGDLEILTDMTPAEQQQINRLLIKIDKIVHRD